MTVLFLFFLQKYLFLRIKKSIFLLKIHILRNNFLQYKPFFTFLSNFILFYVLFTFMYKMYLNLYDVVVNEEEYVTDVVDWD